MPYERPKQEPTFSAEYQEKEPCSYCGGSFRGTIETTKIMRPVPPGAKDLHLYDEKKVTTFRCIGCGAEEVCNYSLTQQCTHCREEAISLYALNFPEMPVSLRHSYRKSWEENLYNSNDTLYICTSCEKCVGCGQPIGRKPWIGAKMTLLNIFKWASGKTKEIFIYAHQECGDQLLKEHDRLLDQYQSEQKLIEHQEKAEAAARLQEERRLKSECPNCGKKLGRLDYLICCTGCGSKIKKG